MSPELRRPWGIDGIGAARDERDHRQRHEQSDDPSAPMDPMDAASTHTTGTVGWRRTVAVGATEAIDEALGKIEGPRERA